MVRRNNWSASGFGKNVSPSLVKDEYLDVEIVILMHGTNLFGDEVYSYLEITGRNLKEMFTKIQNNENLMPSEFGTVLAAGRGQPTPEVRDEMRVSYNMIDIPVPRPPKPAFVQPKFFGDE